MRTTRRNVRNVMRGLTRLGVLMGSIVAPGILPAGQIDVSVVDNAGNPVTGFRWLVQEDQGTHPAPGVAGDPDILSFGFHTSYHPPAADSTGAALQGNTDAASTGTVSNVPDGNYYVSILPYEGYSIGGAPVVVNTAAGTQSVEVTVQKQPIPTAQISILVFQDNAPINAAPDFPEEENPAVGQPGHVDWTQFSLFLEEPAGRYGIAGGQVIQDAFGNPLGTSYIKGCDANGQPDADPLTNYGCLDAAGDPIVDVSGDGTLHPDENGFLQVENLVPGKYGVIIIPPSGGNWLQTTTIEGTQVIDAWVKANEPPFFLEFGPPGPHVFVGFIKSTADGGFPPLTGGTTTVSGRVADIHLSRAPSTAFSAGRDFPGCWIGLNDRAQGATAGLYAAPCDGDSTFEIPNVPAGDYNLVVFDANLDAIISQLPLSVDSTGGTCNGGESCDFGKFAGAPVGIFNWFTRLNTGIFSDDDQDGFWDPTEIGIGPESQDVTLRWRDGTVYQNFPTDGEGFAPFDETFPFFHWLVAEVSFGNKKATGATFVVDAGGPVLPDNGWAYPSNDEMTPQSQCVDDGTGSGATVSYDASGTCPAGSEDNNPNTGNNLSRTEQGAVLTTGFQGFQGQTSLMHFGKADYKTYEFSTNPITYVGENGGISGIVFHATTRAEDEPQFAAAEEWEPGIPRVQVNLYADGDIDSFPQGDFPNGDGDIDWNGDGVLDLDDDIVDDLNGDGVVYADVDNYPLGFSECGDRDDDNLGDAGCASMVGPEDIDRDGDGFFDLGDAVQVTWTDSWDDSLPTGCQGETFFRFDDNALPTDCFDGLRNFNQIRPGVFDGGYAFADYDLDRLANLQGGALVTAIQGYYDHVINTLTAAGVPNVAELQLGLLPGDYIVESGTPVGYQHIKEEDRNVDFGDSNVPSTQALPVACIGEPHTVPQYFSFLTKDGSGVEAQLIDTANIGDPGAFAPFAGDTRPLCDRKKVPLSAGQNAAAEFFLKTASNVPLMANVSGLTLNDLANEFNPNAPNFSEKFAPPWLPVALYDWNGAPLNRVYGDEFGRFNAVLASTFTANVGMPSGMSPNVAQACINDPGPIPDGNGGFMLDPFYDPQYSQFCYTLQFMPGTITYLDTPVVSTAAFAGNGGFPVDCERPDGIPMVASVTLQNGDGPYVIGGQPQNIILTSVGLVDVPNPEFDGTAGTNKVIQRDYGFGPQGNGTVELEDDAGNRTPLTIVSWTDATIEATVPATVPQGDYQLVVTSDDTTSPIVVDPLAESPMGVTLTVGAATDTVHVVPDDYPTIQEAIDAAAAGELILVKPGIYDEHVIMWKPVRLQGWGYASTFISARSVPTENLADWRAKVDALDTAGLITPLPAQTAAPFGFAALADTLFPTEEGSGILVTGPRSGADSFANHPGARIDGFTVVGAAQGGGIIVNAYAEGVEISNNKIVGNAGALGGGIRVGNGLLTHTVADVNDPSYNPANPNINELVYDDGFNDGLRIHHNHVSKNGTVSGSGTGAGISINTGADGYRVSENWVCGNFSQGNGAGIAHTGFSDGGLIQDNLVLFNESFSQMNATQGGGVFIGGLAALEPATGGLMLSPGSGNVTVNANQIRGNLAGGGDGGGLAVSNVNGRDIGDSLNDSSVWSTVSVLNNIIANNVTGLAGGVSIQDSLKVVIRNNTVANNDSIATANVGGAFPPNQVNRSEPQPAGIVSREHSSVMLDLMNLEVTASVPANWLSFSDPELRDNIVQHNRSFYWANIDNPATTVIETGLFAACDEATTPAAECDVAADIDLYTDDFAVMDGIAESAGFSLVSSYSMVTDPTADPNPTGTNISGSANNDDFFNGYFNTDRQATLLVNEPKTLGTAAAFDEGGNFLQVGFGPLTLIEPGSVTSTTSQQLLGYHLGLLGSPAINNGGPTGGVPELAFDIDGEARPVAAGDSDIGADEQVTIVPAALDTDNDGVDDTDDNCTLVANGPNTYPAGDARIQRDTDGDGFGNVCDTDLNNDGITNTFDIGVLRQQYLTPGPDADFNGDGVVNTFDIGVLRQYYLKPPGPAGAL